MTVMTAMTATADAMVRMAHRFGVIRMAAGVAGLMISAGAAAEIYSCKDASGHTLTSDRPIPACADRPVRVLDRNGVVRREIAPPLTEEQKKQKKTEDERRSAEEAARLTQSRSDRALMARFNNEAEINVARQRDTSLVGEQRKRETMLLTELEKKSPPDPTAIASSKKKLADYSDEIKAINARYDAMRARYQTLTANR